MEIMLTQMIQEYRKRGHEISQIYPIDIESLRIKFDDTFQTVEENPEKYGFTEADLDTPIEYSPDQIGFHTEKDSWTIREVSQRLIQVYAGPISFEYMHLSNQEMITWFRGQVEKQPQFELSKEQKRELFGRVCESQMFTDFCIKKYSTSKRFGIDGCDAAISGLEKLVDHSKTLGVKNVIIGMPHRGRLNTLACVFDKPYLELFTEFKDPGIDKIGGGLKDAVWGFSGDVKYHNGASSNRLYEDGSKVTISMPPNPSHLEMVDPVVIGKARAKIDQLRDDTSMVTPVIIHGDAAIAGQGIVYECVQMEKLRHFSVGGTIHAVFNNCIGFTTNPFDARSSRYCTDVARTTSRPVIHVNADFPEHVDFAFVLAAEFRAKFKRDIYVDVIGYRTYGHNEADQPRFTQPKYYEEIEKKIPMYKLYK